MGLIVRKYMLIVFNVEWVVDFLFFRFAVEVNVSLVFINLIWIRFLLGFMVTTLTMLATSTLLEVTVDVVDRFIEGRFGCRSIFW